VELSGAERTMLLGFAVTSREEFLEKTVALEDVLKYLVVPKAAFRMVGMLLKGPGLIWN
jgi:hypothetical protein